MAYDANGNSLNDTFLTFTWDAGGNPVTIGPVSLTYDALDRMVEQSVSGTNSEIVYSPAGVKLALMNGATLTKAFVPLTGGATAVYNSSGLAYYRHTDHLGSSRFASTPARTLYSDTAYAPYGEPYASSGAIDNSFTGQNQDTTAGLYDFLFREQDPNQGRWTSPDPAGLAAVDPTDPQTWNRYSYVLNNPLRAIDPFGLDCVFLNDSGDGVEEIAPELDAVGCGLQGGVYFAGTIDPNSIQFDPNSDFVFASGTAGNSQFSCGGANCDQGALDAFANSIFAQSSASVSGDSSGGYGVNNDVRVGNDLWHNTPRCPHCAQIWQQADCTISGPATEAVKSVADGVALDTFKGAFTARVAGASVVKGVSKSVGEGTFTFLFGAYSYAKMIGQTAWNMVAGCKGD